MKKMYISGPMTGIKENNFPAFFKAEEQLQYIFERDNRMLEMNEQEVEDWEIINPAQLDQKDLVLGEKPYVWYLKRDFKEMCDENCNDICMIGDWHSSNGANAEYSMAKSMSYNIWMIKDDELVPYAYNILEEAKKLTEGVRGEDYGHPKEDFTRVVGMVNSLLSDKLKIPLEATDWPLIMQCVKMSREVNQPKRDNRVDGAGYWNTLQMIHDKDKEDD